MTLEANVGKFETADIFNTEGTLSVNTPQFSVELMAIPTTTENPSAPTHELWGKCARGFEIKWGVLFGKTSKAGHNYFDVLIEGFDWRSRMIITHDQGNEIEMTIFQQQRHKNQD